jgi:hypothetical protein
VWVGWVVCVQTRVGVVSCVTVAIVERLGLGVGGTVPVSGGVSGVVPFAAITRRADLEELHKGQPQSPVVGARARAPGLI